MDFAITKIYFSQKRKKEKNMNKTYKPTILIDLDGVLNKYNGNYDKNFIPEINENAKNFRRKEWCKNSSA